jgi:predicted Rossmann-fold nucleotide-binding protein
VPVGRLFHAPDENKLTTDEIWRAIKENRIKLPNTIAIDRFGSVSFTPHKVEYTIPAKILPRDHERLVRGELGRSFIDKIQLRKDVEIVSIPPNTGILTSCSIYLQEHYVVLNRGPGNFGLHSGAVLLDPIKTWGTNIMLEICNTCDQRVVNPVVSVDVFRAPSRTDETEVQLRKRRLAIHRDLKAIYEALDAKPKQEDPEVKPRTRVNFRGRHSMVDNDALVVNWDRDVKGVGRAIPANFQGYRNLAQAMANAPENADTLIVDFFPGLFEHIELLARLPELHIRRIVFRTSSRYHGFFLSSDAQSRLDAYHQIGVQTYFYCAPMNDLFIYTTKKDHGFFVREESAKRFQQSTIIAFYGSAVPVDGSYGVQLQKLISRITGYFGPHVGIMTGGGGGVMGLAAEEARKNKYLTGACFLELEAQPPEFGVDFFNTFQETSRHNRQKWFEVADFCIFNIGGIGTLEEIGIELCNLKLGIRPRVPYVFFSDGYWDDLQRQVKTMISTKRAPAWISDYLLFTGDPDEVISFYKKRLQIL